jgi:hypothetical protein
VEPEPSPQEPEHFCLGGTVTRMHAGSGSESGS